MSLKKIVILLCLVVLVLPLAAEANTVKIVQDAGGFRIFVDEQPFEVKGVVWSFTPIGENYNYDLWSQPETFIQNMIDTDARLMEEMGVNTIRVFDDIPPEWVEYLYLQYGIHTIINPLFGRYGMQVRGIWHPVTDYSDWYTRLAVQEEALEAVEKYRDVPGVLMFLFGNENNYGLEWDAGGVIEDLPVGQQMESRAGYLYSLFEETISVAKTMDPNHPMGLINGDIQYFNIIRELVPSLDIIGINTYRGSKSYDLFFQSITRLNIPFIYTELGADAFNARTDSEDQYHQALYIRDQWEEIYQQSWNKEREQNCVGAVVFEWMDEWWKHGMELGLDIHEKEGTWTNGGYGFDAVPGIPNMNEEWFGIVAQSEHTWEGINMRIPRAAYYMLADIWELSMYDATDAEITGHFAAIDPAVYLSIALERKLGQTLFEMPAIIEAVNLRTSLRGSFTDVSVADGVTGVTWGDAEELDITLNLPLARDLSGNVRLKFRGNTYDPLFAEPPVNQEAVQLYSAEFTYDNPYFDITGYYHTGHPDWFIEGDWFYLMPESWDLYSMDQEASQAPFGIEFVGEQQLEGLTLYAGPEIYWGAVPQLMGKYYREFTFRESDWETGFSLLHAEPLALQVSNPAAPGPSRKSSVYGFAELQPFIRFDAGVLFSGMEMLGLPYQYAEAAAPGTGYLGSDWNIYNDGEISLVDTFAGKLELSTEILRYTRLYARYTYAGLVAESKPQLARSGFFKSSSGSGNRQSAELGAQIILWDFVIWPELRWNAPLQRAIPAGLGVSRNPLADPFYVYDNRELLEGEIVLSYDETGATYFHEWNSKDIENADFAASISLLYTFYAGATDPGIYKNADGDYAAFSVGLPEVRFGFDEFGDFTSGLWQATARMTTNPLPALRVDFGLRAGHQQSTGEDTRIVNYYGGDLSVRYDRIMLQGLLDINSWGPELWYREFNLTYPWQWSVDLSYGFDTPSFMDSGNRVGLKWEGRSYGQYAAGDEPDDGYLSGITLYVDFRL